MKIQRVALVAVTCVAFAAALTAVTPRGTFTIDDSNYLATLVALRAGGLHLPGTEALPASPEWYAFDPSPPARGPPRMPVYPTAPALWAPFALLFGHFGLGGLIFLNALSFALTVVLVHHLCALHAAQGWTPLWAAALFGLGSYSLEYAQGIWPHMFAVMLVTAGCFAAAKARQSDSRGFAAAAGCCAALAAGVRYQNVVVVAALGLGLLLFSRRRFAVSLAFAAGAAGPLLISAWINLERLGLFHPATKGRGYGVSAVPLLKGHAGWMPDALVSFWARIVDFSVHPPIPLNNELRFWEADPDLGVFVTSGAVKKALLQSAPWFALAFALMLLAWRRSEQSDGRRVEARALLVICAAVIAAFSLAGTGATDGLCFNARYFLELLPGAAVVAAWGLERSPPGARPYLLGALFGAVLIGIAGFGDTYSLLRSEMLRFAPLLLAALAVSAVLVQRRRPRLLPAAVAACAVWAFGAHALDDLPASYRMRQRNAELLAATRAQVPPRSALFVWGSERDAVWPLWALEDTWTLDLGKDGGHDGPMLVGEMLSRGRRVFVYRETPPALVEWLVRETGLSAEQTWAEFIELRQR